MSSVWYRSQSIVAGILAAYEIVAIIWFTDTSRFAFPLANFMGFIAVAGYLPIMIVLLIVGQEILVRRGNPVVSKRERRLLVGVFALIGLSLVMLGIHALVVENLLVWLVAIALAFVSLARLHSANRRGRA